MTTSTSLIDDWFPEDKWYPERSQYYYTSGLDKIPVRQGDLLAPGETCRDKKGRLWLGCLVTHPSCEIITKDLDRIQVCRVRLLRETSSKFQTYISAGQRINHEGVSSVAMAHTFFLPPATEVGRYSEAMFADYQSIAIISKEEASQDRRIAALTSEARVYYIRRYLYWRQRWYVKLLEVAKFEADRIGSDPSFGGARPVWARR